jgi:hypothetical protein
MRFTVDPNVLANATRGPILSSLSKLCNRVPAQWLPRGHAASRGELPTKWGTFRSVQVGDAIDAVALSAPQHCMDGWAFVSRALGSLLAGDPHAARHLAYYAQLRSGLSILANLGVGIFNGVNFAVTSTTTVERIDPEIGGQTTNKGMGTHIAVWEALFAWSASAATASILLDLIRIRGSTLNSCISSLWPGFSAATSANSLISAWGIDLQRGVDEHRQRNISSYAPHALNPLPQHVTMELAFVEEFWELFEPSTGPNFDNLDRHLLRMMFWKQHDLVGGVPRDQGALGTHYKFLPAQIAAIASQDFLIGTTEPNVPNLLNFAKATTHPARPTEMISRALLLLRAATALTYENLVAAGVNCANGDLRPWLDKLAIDRGYWKPGAALANTTDLFADVSLALMDLAKSKPTDPACLYDWLSSTNRGIPTIAEAERIGVWCLSG